MSTSSTAGKGKRVQAEVSSPRPILLPEDGHARKRGGAAEKRGWSLFNEDVRRGRFFALVGLAFLLAAAVSFATSPESQKRICERLKSAKVPFDGPLEILPGIF